MGPAPAPQAGGAPVCGGRIKKDWGRGAGSIPLRPADADGTRMVLHMDMHMPYLGAKNATCLGSMPAYKQFLGALPSRGTERAQTEPSPAVCPGVAKPAADRLQTCSARRKSRAKPCKSVGISVGISVAGIRQPIPASQALPPFIPFFNRNVDGAFPDVPQQG